MRSDWQRTLVLALAALVTAPVTFPAPVAAQTAGQPAGKFAERAEVVVVEVPVYVTRDGKPVRGLTQQSFEVYDGRDKLPIVGFDAVDLKTATSEHGNMVTRVPIAARRHFVLMFDAIFSDLGTLTKAREAGLKFVRDQLQPTDVAAVGLYTAGGARLLLNFTSDRAQLEAAVATLGAPKLIELHPDPFGLTMSTNENVKAYGSTAGEGVGGGARAEIAAAVQDNLQSLARNEANVNRTQNVNEVIGFSRSFADLARNLGAAQGRKYLVYFSEGFDHSLVAGEAPNADNNTRIEFGQSYDVSSDAMYGNTRLAGEVERMLEEFRRADFSIQAIDIAGVKAGNDQRARTEGESSLLQMAKDTGGELYKDFNHLDDALGQLMDKTSVVYVLTVQPQGLKPDGKFHQLKVKLVNAPSGAEVHARPGFYAPGGKVDETAQLRASLGQSLLGGAEGGDLGAHLLVAPFPMAEGKAYVPVLVEIEGPSLLEGAHGDKISAQLFVYAFDAQGRVAAYVTKDLGLDLGKVGKALQASGLKYWGHLTLPPGVYDVRMLLRVKETGRVRLSSSELRVPTFGSETALTPPLFPEPQGKWLMLADANRPNVAYPFMIAQQPFVPAVHPQVPSKGDTTLQLVGYNLPAGELKATAELLGADGKTVTPATLVLGKRETGPQGTTHLAASLGTAGVAAGEYTLVITLAGADGAAQRSVLPVAVGG
jgi:VWFA-related protein